MEQLSYSPGEIIFRARRALDAVLLLLRMEFFFPSASPGVRWRMSSPAWLLPCSSLTAFTAGSQLPNSVKDTLH